MAEVGTAAPFSEGAFAALRAHPAFRDTVEDLARGNLASYGALKLAERWLYSDLGRAALTGAALVLDAALGGFTTAQLVAAARTNRTCSEGRVRHYLRRAIANGFLDVDAAGAHRPTGRMHAVMGRGAATLLAAAARLDPAVAPAAAAAGDIAFRRRLSLQVGLNTMSRPDLFAGPEKPVVLFLGRDGGARMLERLIAAQAPGRRRLLESAPVSQRGLAASAFVSRMHVARLLADGAARGLLAPCARGVAVAPELSEDVERHYALVLEMARVSARAALAQGA